LPPGVGFALNHAELLQRRRRHFRTLDRGGLVSAPSAFLGAPAGGPPGLVPHFCYVRDRELAVHHPTPPSGGISVPNVVRSEGLVQDWGLFPASELEAQVLVQCSSSPLGYGAQRLTLLELGGLWDLPILIMGALPPASTELMLRAFCKTAPTKVLPAGADLLLTTSFRGGFGGLKTTFGGPKSVEAYGPRPLSNSDLRLSIPLACTAPPMLDLLDAVHKGDSQKADDETVPVHLWLCAFALGYGDPSCLARHQVALGLVGGLAGSLANTEPPLGWQGSMAGFRVFGLRYWEKRVVRGYYRWCLTNLPRQANLPTPAQFVEFRMGMVLGSVQLVYE
jgi:hypothetical protein